LPERTVGEISIRGNSTLSEYYRRPDITQQSMRNGWLNTGDMGYLAEGHLYVTGRKKDLIIVGGKNIYPQDVEAIANGVPGIHPGRAVAFGLPDERLGTEGIVIVAEVLGPDVAGDAIQVERELRRRIVQQVDVALADVRLVGKGWVIKTSSGKLARSANQDKYRREFRRHNGGNRQVDSARAGQSAGSEQ
jgi:acyl-CoA synthetase (AMP-forming)/AMP-acid ligase II